MAATGSRRHEHRPCFVVSTGRCGSKMLALALGRHPALCALHEPRPYLVTEGYLRWSGRRDSAFVHRKLEIKRDELIGQIDANGLAYVESSNFLAHLIPELEERYAPRFVHLYRDGRDFVRSGLARYWYRNRGAPRRRATRWLRRRLCRPFGEIWEDHRLPPPADLTGRFDRIAWLWREINECILDLLQRVPDARRTEVRLEAFDRETAEGLLDFLEVEVDERRIEEMLEVAARRPNRTEDPEGPPPERWSEERRTRFRAIAGPMMERLGYDGG